MNKKRLLQLILSFVLLGVLLAACDEPAPSPSPEATQAPPSATDDAYPGPEESADTAYPATEAEAAYPATETEIVIPDASGSEGGDGGPVESGDPPPFPGKLAFHSERTGALQIFVMEGETGAISQPVNMPNQSFEPSWAPDCQGLAFTAGTNNNFDVYTIGGANAEPVLLPVSEPDIYNWSAAWSPTGEVIAYQHNKDALMNVCFNDGNGNHLTCMERDDFSNAMPAWSPNGDSFAFGSNRDGDWDLYLSPYPPTGDLVRLTDNKDIDFHPRFSPDGERIVFASKRGGNYDIYVVNADGSGEVQLTSGSSDERTPVWVGDDLIAFSLKHFEDENWELYLVNADGTNARRLTFSAGTDQWPAWCPTQ